MMKSNLETIINHAFDERASLSPAAVPTDIKNAIQETLELLNTGQIRVAEKVNQQWKTNEWVKKAVLLYFRTHDNQLIQNAFGHFYDKVALKFANYSAEDFKSSQIRVVPPATVRFGSYIAKGTVLMPSYVNIGAYIDENVMVDTWATVGSCAQIGKNVHLSGGVGIGGVLEPLQANPTIIEDDCFIGARSEIVEGVVVEKGSVISMGVYIGQSTKIYDRETQDIHYGRVPAGSVVIPGSLPSSDGCCQQYCAVIIKKVDEKTRAKVGINELLRN